MDEEERLAGSFDALGLNGRFGKPVGNATSVDNAAGTEFRERLKHEASLC